MYDVISDIILRDVTQELPCRMQTRVQLAFEKVSY